MEFFKRFTIAKKIATGYVVILLLTIISGMYSIMVFNRSMDIDKAVSNVYQPSLKMLEELALMIARSERLTNNWIFQPTASEKQELRDLHSSGYDAVKQKVSLYSSQWDNAADVLALKETLKGINKLFEVQNKIMLELNSIEAYDNATLVETAIALQEGQVTPISAQLKSDLAAIIKQQEQVMAGMVEAKNTSFNTVKVIIILSLIIAVTSGGISALLSTRSITRPVNQLKDSIIALSKGELSEINIRKADDEVGDMIESCNLLVKGLKKTAEFTQQIAEGKLDVKYETLSNIKALDNALFAMQRSLMSVSKEDEKRNWSATGLAKFSEILRDQSDFHKFGDAVISNLIKYIGANQGGLFIINDSDEKDRYIELLSCYAWNKKKFVEKRIEPGEGLVGQCWLEGLPIYMTQVPEDYVDITSGLGHAKPRAILVCPLKINDEILGVLEIASFTVLEDYKRTFVDKLCENIAAAISTAKVTARTQLLLQQTTQQAEEMRAQEEEMRQNMEELSATQEEMSRKEREYLKRIAELEARLTVKVETA